MQSGNQICEPDVSVVVVSFNTKHLLEQMFRTLQEAMIGLQHEVIVIDNASTDGSAEWIRINQPEAHLICNSVNVGFGRANNQALPIITGRHVLLLNTDAFPDASSVHRSIEFLEKHPETGLVGVRLIGRDATLQPSCRYFPTPANIFLNRTGLARWFKGVRLIDDMNWSHQDARECDWVPGCFYLIRKDVIKAVGLFDPRFFLYYEEVDHCLRVKQAGWKVFFLGTASCVHLGGESASSLGNVRNSGRQISALQVESEILYFRKHLGLWGVGLHLCLAMVSDLILLAKSALKKLLGHTVSWETTASRTMIEIARQTRMGSTPTR